MLFVSLWPHWGDDVDHSAYNLVLEIRVFMPGKVLEFHSVISVEALICSVGCYLVKSAPFSRMGGVRGVHSMLTLRICTLLHHFWNFYFHPHQPLFDVKLKQIWVRRIKSWIGWWHARCLDPCLHYKEWVYQLTTYAVCRTYNSISSRPQPYK